MARLGDVCTIYTGTGFPVQYQGKTTGEYPFYKVGDISKNVLKGYQRLRLCENYISSDVVLKIKGTILPANTVVFAKIGEAVKLNRRAITESDCLVDNNVMGICPDATALDLQYFFHYMCNLQLGKYAEATTVPSIKKSVIEEIEVPIPSLEKQHKIAIVLDKINDLVMLRKRQIDKLDEAINSRFQELFGDISVNDREWEVHPLGELCSIVRGGSPRPIGNFLGGDVPWIKIGDAASGENIYLYMTKEHIIQEGIRKSRFIKAGSLIFANCGDSLGFARIITFDGCIHDGWLALEDITKKLDKIFLLQALNQMTEHFRRLAPTGTQPNLNTAIMKAHKQVVPPIDLQREFSAFAVQVEKSKAAAQKSLDKFLLLKASLMQQYFG